MVQKSRSAKKRRTTVSGLNFSSVYFIANDGSTNAARARKFWRDVVRLVGKEHTEVLEVAKMSVKQTEAAIVEVLKKCDQNSLVCVGGGDGTVSTVIRAVVNSHKLTDENKAAAILPLWGGNANDMAVMLNGMPSTVNMTKILKNARKRKIYPLQITLSSDHEQLPVHVAGCYASFGATAEALARMEDSAHVRDAKKSKHKLTRFVMEFKEIGKTVFSVQPITVQPEKQQTTELYDRLFVNGSRYAKILRSPVELHERRYFVLTSKDKNWWRFIVRTVRPLVTRAGGKISDRQRSFTLKDPTYMQVDGEVFQLPANTHVTVSIATTSPIVLSCKLSD